MPDRMPDRHVQLYFILDTNCINSRQRIPAMNQMETWSSDGIIDLEASQVVWNEARAGNSVRRQSKACEFITTISCIDTDEETAKIAQIEQILFPGGASNQNQRNDAEIVFNAWKYMATLITNDGGSRSQPGGVLGNRARLDQLGIQVMTPEEAVTHVRQVIEARDAFAQLWSQETGQPLPDWVGKD